MIAALPGPPREMTAMWEEQLKPRLVAEQDSVIYYKIVRTFALGESTMETKLLPLIDRQTDPTIATYAKEGECSLLHHFQAQNFRGSQGKRWRNA